MWPPPCHLVPTLICAAEEAQEAASKRLEKEMRRLSMPFQNSCNNSHRRSNLNLLTSKGKGKKGKGKSTQVRRMLRLPLTLRTLLQALQETLSRFQKNKKGNLIANITRVITTAQNGKLDQDEGENTLPKLSNRDQQTRGKGKGQGNLPRKFPQFRPIRYVSKRSTSQFKRQKRILITAGSRLSEAKRKHSKQS